MRAFEKRPALRWIAPVAALAVVGGGLAVGQNASADPSLPTITPDQLVANVMQAKVDHVSGSVTETAELGLPSLPISNDQGSTDFTSLISGTHQLQVWSSGEDKSRVMLTGKFGESDLVRNGTDVWAWNQGEKKATHVKLPSDASQPQRTPMQMPTTPEEAAKQALNAIGKTTTVELANNQMVAGQGAYELVLTPKETGSTVGSVRIAVDAKTYLPLRVQVFATGADQPALSVRYDTVDYKAIPDSTFDFSPPAGTTVETKTVPAPSEQKSKLSKAERQAAAEKARQDVSQNVKTVGTGWTEVVVAKLPSDALSGGSGSAPGSGRGNSGSAGGADQWQQVLNSLPTASGKGWTGHVLQGTLFSVVLTDDGRVAAGAVAPERLYSALG